MGYLTQSHRLIRIFLSFGSISCVSGIGWTADALQRNRVYRTSAITSDRLELAGNLLRLRDGSVAVLHVLAVVTWSLGTWVGFRQLAVVLLLL